MHMHNSIFVSFTKYLLHVSALTAPSSAFTMDDGAVRAETCSRYLVNNTNIQMYNCI
jgi:hypothetical protein